MDEWMLNDLLECSVCLERLDTSSKVLPCQHTFCKKCLEEIVESHKELRCPECRVLVDVTIEELPPNVLLMRILEGMKNAPKKRTSATARSGVHAHGASSASVHLHMQQQQSHHHHHSSPAHTPTTRSNHDHNAQHTSPKQAILPGQPCARALYSYTSPEAGDLTFKKGDIILLKKKVDANWFHGECNGSRGVFPSVYVEVITPLPSPLPQCKALYDFRMATDEEEGCLTFTKGEIINVIRRVDENWAEGKMADRIGIFPLAFVELNQVARALMKLSTNSQPGPSRVAPPTPTSEETTPLIPTVEHHTAVNPHAQPTLTTANTQAPAAVASHLLHRLGGPTSSSSQSPSSSTTPNSSSTSCSSPSSTAPSSPASPPPHPGEHPPPPHPRNTSSTSSLGQHPPPQHQREKRHSLNLINAVNPTNTHRLSGEISSHIDLAVGPQTDQQTTASQLGNGKNHRHRRSISDQPSALAASVASGSTPQTQISTQLPALYVAMYPYKPQKTDELELKKGALYMVTEKCQDGWFKGTAQGSHKTGVFPGNYVALAKSQGHGAAPSGAGGGSRGGGGTPRSNGLGPSPNSASWSRPFGPNSNSGTQQSRQNKGTGSNGTSSERPYMDTVRSMFAAAQAAMHNVTTSQASASPITSKPALSAAGQFLITPPELPPRAVSPSSMGTPTSNISTSWHAQPTSSNPSVSTESAQVTPLGRSQSHTMVGVLTSVAAPPNVTVHAYPNQVRSNVEKTKEKKSSSSGLIRRLTTMKKCKSPPPTTYSMDNPVFEDGICGIVSRASNNVTTLTPSTIQPSHARSGSCPSQLLQLPSTVESSKTLSESIPLTKHNSTHQTKGTVSGTGATVTIGVLTSGSQSQRVKHKERGAIVTANPAALSSSSSSTTSRPAPLGASSSGDSSPSLALAANHRKSSSLDASTTDVGKKPKQLFPPVKERFRCIVPYPPNSEYELALQVGDVIHVHKKRDDGWYKGTQERTGRTGLFPASFVEAL